VNQLRAAGAEKVWRGTASGVKTDRAQLRRVLDQLEAGGRKRSRGSVHKSPTPKADAQISLAPRSRNVKARWKGTFNS
jgi:hypothetical protein